jgi:hypothetical protein
VVKVEVRAEFIGSEFPDRRLSRRLEMLATSMAEAPGDSFPRRLTESELEGAYRFFGNERVRASTILAPHVEATLGRIADQECIVAHDTTTLSFRAGGDRQGLSDGHRGNQVLHAHVSLAIGAQQSPLGVLALRTYVGAGATTQHERWVEQALAVAKLLEVDRVIHVMDREADDYKLYAAMVAGGHRFVVRAQPGRLISWDKQEQRLGELLGSPFRATRTILVSKRADVGRGSSTRKAHPARQERMAELSFVGAEVTVGRSTGSPRALPAELKLGVVRVWEQNPPKGEPAVDWLLVTNEPVRTRAEVLRVVDYYRSRWAIEEYFKALKSGCAIEKRQLETRHALENALALFLPIAWALMQLRGALRNDPGAPASALFPETHLAMLGVLARKPLSANPSVRDAVLAIAALGGHLRRNGDPGWITLSRGYEELIKAMFVARKLAQM